MATLTEYRCAGPDCNRLLFRGYLAPGSIVEPRCPSSRCKFQNHFEVVAIPSVTVTSEMAPDGVGGYVPAA